MRNWVSTRISRSSVDGKVGTFEKELYEAFALAHSLGAQGQVGGEPERQMEGGGPGVGRLTSYSSLAMVAVWGIKSEISWERQAS